MKLVEKQNEIFQKTIETLLSDNHDVESVDAIVDQARTSIQDLSFDDLDANENGLYLTSALEVIRIGAPLVKSGASLEKQVADLIDAVSLDHLKELRNDASVDERARAHIDVYLNALPGARVNDDWHVAMAHQHAMIPLVNHWRQMAA